MEEPMSEMPSLHPNYKIVEVLGCGAMGTVYRALDLRLQRYVAVKSLNRPGSDESWTELKREARIGARLHHPGIAVVFGLEAYEDTALLVMELVEGQSMSDLLEQGPLDVSEAVDVLCQLTDALAHAHSRGILHRDLKPSNLMLADGGQVKILDFGIAGTLSDHPSSKGSAPGTLAYMAPERIQNLPVDERSDLFSVGTILFEMLTAGRLWDGSSRSAVARAVLENAAPFLTTKRPDIPIKLESIFQSLVTKDPEKRPGSAEELAIRLHELRPEFPSKPGKPGESQGVVGQADHSPEERGKGLMGLYYSVRSFLNNLNGLKGSELDNVAAPEESPIFRGLTPFLEQDRGSFFGRKNEIQNLLSKTQGDERFHVLHGSSGTGKTSILRAGLMPELRRRGYQPIYLRPSSGIERFPSECARQCGIRVKENESLIRYLKRLGRELKTTLVVVFDQFEELFTLMPPDEQDTQLDLISSIYNDQGQKTKIILSLRSDFLFEIDADLGATILNPLGSARLFQLLPFNKEQGREILTRSVETSAHLDASLIEAVLEDLTEQDRIQPSELQIMGTQIQARRITRLIEYRRNGGKHGLVHAFIGDVVDACANQETAHLLLSAFISSEGTKATLTRQELEMRVQRPKNQVRAILSSLVEHRLVSEIQDQEPWRYELTHEYLIGLIEQITGRAKDAQHRANRLFRHYLNNKTVDAKSEIPLRHLWFIRRYSDLPVTESEKKLLKRSLRLGIRRAALQFSGLALVLIGVTALLSVEEEWHEERLRGGHLAAARSAALSPDGTILVTGGEDQELIVWNFQSRRIIKRLKEHDSSVVDVEYASNGEFFVSGGNDGQVIFWSAVDFKTIDRIEGNRAPIDNIAISHDSSRLAVLRLEEPKNQVSVWDISNLDSPLYKRAHTCSRSVLSFSPDNRFLIMNRGDQLDLLSGEYRSHRFRYNKICTGHPDYAISPDGNQYLGLSSSGEAWWGDARDYWSGGDMELKSPLPTHGDNGRSVAWSLNGELVATAAEDIALWDPNTESLVGRFAHTSIVWSAVFSRDGKYLISTHGDGSIIVWDLKERRKVANFSEHSGPVREVVFSRRGNLIASGGEDRSIVIWNAEESSKERTFSGHDHWVQGLAFRKNDKEIISCGYRDGLMRWPLGKSAPISLKGIPNRKSICFALAVSKGLPWAASSGGIFDLEGNRHLRDFELADRTLSSSFIKGLDFSPNGSILALTEVARSPGHPSSLFLWRTGTWELIDHAQPSDPSVSMEKVDFSQDGHHLVTGDIGGGVRLWQVSPLAEIALLGSHASRVKAVRFFPDGNRVASVGDDGMIAVWSVQRRTLDRVLGTHTAPVLAIDVSPDGNRIVTGEHDQSVRLFTRRRKLWGTELPLNLK